MQISAFFCIRYTDKGVMLKTVIIQARCVVDCYTDKHVTLYRLLYRQASYVEDCYTDKHVTL